MKLLNLSLLVIMVLTLVTSASATNVMNAQTLDTIDQRLHLYSQVRFAGESSGHAYQRFTRRLVRYQQRGQGQPVPNTTTVVKAATTLERADFTKLPVWSNAEDTLKNFKAVRNLQFLIDRNHGDMKRRSSWLFPDDGCFARAALMGQNLEGWKIVRPMKLFIFGNLSVKTVNSPDGVVRWWYHVVPVISMSGQPVVLDPAINPLHPLTVKEWVNTMTADPASIKVSVCLPTTYGPSGACDGVDPDDKNALSDQGMYLSYEWARLVQLHRDPVRELGQFPPWQNWSLCVLMPCY